MVIYLDWQIFQYIKSPRKNNKYDELLRFIIQNHSPETVFPYSVAHLNDLYNAFKKSGEITTFIKEDLDLIRNSCDSVLIHKDYKTNEIKLVKYDPVIYFDQIIKDKKEDVFNIESIGKVFDDIPGGSVYRKIFEELINQKIPNPNREKIADEQLKTNQLLEIFQNESFTINDFFVRFSDFFKRMNSEHDFYKELRQQSSQIKKFYNSHATKDQDIFRENLDFIYKYYNKKFDEQDFYTQYTTAYSLLDITGIRSEKITRKNHFPNISNDSIHSFYGQNSDFYITEDDANYQKSKFLAEYFQIKNRVVKLDEFIDLIEISSRDA